MLLPGVNFINFIRTKNSYAYDVSAAFPSYMYVEKAAETMFLQKTCAYDVDEIGYKSKYQETVLVIGSKESLFFKAHVTLDQWFSTFLRLRYTN